jgi:hypothetical protein
VYGCHKIQTGAEKKNNDIDNILAPVEVNETADPIAGNLIIVPFSSSPSLVARKPEGKNQHCCTS